MTFKDTFIRLWRERFNGAELPIAFYYTDEEGRAERPGAGTSRCLIGALSEVRGGRSLCFDAEANAPESFLITESWQRVQERIG